MPEISRFYGLVVKMIFNDNDKHHKPHVHVYYGEYEASVALDGEVLDGKIPVKQFRMLAGWMAIHEDELYPQLFRQVAYRQASLWQRSFLLWFGF